MAIPADRLAIMDAMQWQAEKYAAHAVQTPIQPKPISDLLGALETRAQTAPSWTPPPASVSGGGGGGGGGKAQYQSVQDRTMNPVFGNLGTDILAAAWSDSEARRYVNEWQFPSVIRSYESAASYAKAGMLSARLEMQKRYWGIVYSMTMSKLNQARTGIGFD